MEKLGFILRIDEPTEWCTGMVVVPKSSGQVRICIDFTKLNMSDKRENFAIVYVQFVFPSPLKNVGYLA
jgi:hypothetical protein